jgi:L-ascorbate metabolism protein UlaG (beta-lactamase superfamily)
MSGPTILKYLGHSCFELRNSQGKIAIIDPYLNGNPHRAIRAEDIERVDVVIVTHGGRDHLGDAYEIVKRTGAYLISSVDVYHGALRAGIPKEQLFGMPSGAVHERSGFRIKATDARHVSMTKLPDLYITGQPLGFLIWPEKTASEIYLYHLGDTSITYDMKMAKELWAPPMAIVGFGGPPELPHDMDPDEASIAVEWLGVRYAVPMHFWPPSGDAQRFADAVARRTPDVKVHVMSNNDELMLESAMVEGKRMMTVTLAKVRT